MGSFNTTHIVFFSSYLTYIVDIYSCKIAFAIL